MTAIRCEQSVFVDRTEYQEAKILTCPLPSCTHAWCKACQQTITPNVTGPQHSCDGSSELDHLMGQQGWKYCPGKNIPCHSQLHCSTPRSLGCKTPVMKTDGCNHMTVSNMSAFRKLVLITCQCMSPGCNTSVLLPSCRYSNSFLASHF